MSIVSRKVLPAGRVGTTSRGGKDGRAADAVGAHPAQRIGQEWMPVAIAPMDGNIDERLQRSDEGAFLVVDRAAPAEQLVSLRDFEQLLVRHAAAAGDHFGDDSVSSGPR